MSGAVASGPDTMRLARTERADLADFRARRRIRGLRLIATDLDWSTGDGPAVEGPAESLLMVLAGRPITDELTGSGQATLAARIG